VKAKVAGHRVTAKARRKAPGMRADTLEMVID
jgi:hypothetical protein